MVPASYAVDGSQLLDEEEPHLPPNPKDCVVSIKVGWVKGLSRLYFLYEAPSRNGILRTRASAPTPSRWWWTATPRAVP